MIYKGCDAWWWPVVSVCRSGSRVLVVDIADTGTKHFNTFLKRKLYEQNYNRLIICTLSKVGYLNGFE